MRNLLLAGCFVCLAVLAAPALAEAAPPDEAMGPEVAAAAAEQPAPAPAAPSVAEPSPADPAPALATTDVTACPAEPLSTPTRRRTWCGDPCSEPSAESYCVGYDCSGTLRLDRCYCQESRWTCGWQNCPW